MGWVGHGLRVRWICPKVGVGLLAQAYPFDERPPMAPNTKRVFYVNNVAAPVYLEILAKRPDIHVDTLVNDSPESEVEPVLAQAHAYQIGSSRQELVMSLQGYAPLLARCP